jgi:hypothetical protein
VFVCLFVHVWLAGGRAARLDSDVRPHGCGHFASLMRWDGRHLRTSSVPSRYYTTTTTLLLRIYETKPPIPNEYLRTYPTVSRRFDVKLTDMHPSLPSHSQDFFSFFPSCCISLSSFGLGFLCMNNLVYNRIFLTRSGRVLRRL